MTGNGKVPNTERESKTDPEARVARMKGGTAHLAYKAENAVDLKNSIVVAGCVTHGDEGDTQTIRETLQTAKQNLKEASRYQCILEAMSDKGYHETEFVRALNEDLAITTYMQERNPIQCRHWCGDQAA